MSKDIHDDANNIPENEMPLDTEQVENSDNIAPELEVEAESAESKLEKELADFKDKYIRLVADFENVKKRNAKERLELLQTANKDVIVNLLDVLDDCDRAEKQLEITTDINQIKEGISLVFSKLRQTLQNKGLKAFESINEDFNVDKHEAITEIPAPDKAGKVIDEIQKGYTLNEALIRHAKVVVGK